LINKDGIYKNLDELKSIFEENKVDLSKPIITSCGSGITACVLIFALELIGKNDTALYDGSWTEWGCRTDTPIEI
ncbi:MAG: rhodanese-like domain-containing protein, partial [Emcibacteraceae bacterium]|nr:rhodanese-like domain-containing protein [Emcibacteraceae bacterium]